MFPVVSQFRAVDWLLAVGEKDCWASVSSHCTVMVAVMLAAPVEGSVVVVVWTEPPHKGPRAVTSNCFHWYSSYCARSAPEPGSE